MSFLHLSLLAGLAAISVPLMLHLFGQRQPQLIDFPALRFVRETKQEKRSSWQLRHILLLLLRILLLAALVFALARPRVHSAVLGGVLGMGGLGLMASLASLVALVAWVSRRPFPVWLTSGVIAGALWLSAAWWGYQTLSSGPAVPSADQSSPVAAAILVDNGPTMTYRSNNELRLNAAKDFALWILEQLPVDSQVGVLTGVPIGSLALDPATAKTQVKIIEPRGAHVDLLSRIRTSLELVLSSPLDRREIYVLTDLMSPAWSVAQPGLIELLDEHRGEVLVQIIDLGSEDRANWRLGDPKPDSVTIPSGGDTRIEIAVNPPQLDDFSGRSSVNVELHQEEIDPRLPLLRNGKLETAPVAVVDRRVLEFTSAGPQTVTLRASGLAAGTHHFTIRLEQQDPLEIDNTRFVSIQATDLEPTLIVADNPAVGEILRLIVDPEGSLADLVSYSQLSQVDLTEYAVVCLLDPKPLPQRDAEQIKDHTELGGGLFLILGPSLPSAERLAGNPLGDFLPGQLGPMVRREQSDRSQFFDLVAVSHPILNELAEADVPWQQYPVFSSWTFQSKREGALELITLSGTRDPILLSHDLGDGQVITLCTPIPQPYARGDRLWNELWVGDNVWPAWALLRTIFQVASGANAESLNFAVGMPINLRNDPLRWPSRYELFTPEATSRRVEAADGTLSLTPFVTPGTYYLRGIRGRPVSRGFSVNAPASDTRLERLSSEQLQETLGDGNYSVAQNRDEVQSSVGQARYGRELYPLIMVLVAGLFLAEQAMSNRFYEIKFQGSKQSSV